MLADRIEHYKETGKSLSNTPAQYKKEFEWLKEVDSLALANAQLNLNKAYKNFSVTNLSNFQNSNLRKAIIEVIQQTG
jgi:putative transposase